MAKRALFDTLRSLAYTSISGAYAAVGGAFTVTPVTIRIINSTDGDMIFSDDDTNTAGKLFIPAGSYVLYDLQANMNPNIDDGLVLAIGTIISVKQISVPTKGSVYIELIHVV